MNMSVDVLFLCLTACVKGSTCREFLLTERAASVAAPRPVVTESLRTKIRKVFIPFRRSRTESVFSEPVESFFFRWWENPVSASGFSSSPTDFPVALMGTASSVGATFMSPAWVRRCAACAPSCLVGVCLSASVPGVINGAPTLRLSCVRGKAGRFSIAGVRTPATGGVLTCVAARKTGRFPAWFVAVGTAPCGCGQGWCQSMRFT